jgi:alpha-galactosidase
MKSKIFFIMLLCSIFGVVAPAQTSDDSLLILNTNDLSLIFEVNKEGTLLHRYFGQRISTSSFFLSKEIYRVPDYGTPNEAYSTMGGKNFREPALRVTHYDGDLNTELYYEKSKRVIKKEQGIEEMTILMRDRKHLLEVRLVYQAYQKENVYAMSSEMINNEKGNIVLHSFYSFYLPVEANKYFLTHFYGTPTAEMSMNQIRLSHGIKSIETKKGIRTTHGENPSFLISLDHSISEDYGEVIGGALAWSGNFKLNFELDEFNVLNISAGINPYASEYHLKKGQRFQTPMMIFTYSNNGAGNISRHIHDWARRDGLYMPDQIRPIVLNSWEGVYFDFTEAKLKEMIDGASNLGIEIFVLDDGWFGNKYPRNNAKMGLGDWQVNKEKLPNGLDNLAEYAATKGMKFGIWIEPEMVNPESELAKLHPDWIVKAQGRSIPTRRNQWVLDVSNPAVQDFIFHTFDTVLSQSKNISYVKWDANRHLESIGSSYMDANSQSHFFIDYIKGLYRVYDRIRKKYPEVMIQLCASGGGRVEYGALRYHQDFWTSDNTDAFSRAFIQYGTNFIYPAIATGAHFSHVPNRHTKRIIPAKFRMDMAMTGRLGFEMKLSDLTNEETEMLKKSIREYKQIRDIIQFGDLYRISSPYSESGIYSLMYVSKDKKRAVFYMFSLKYNGPMFYNNLKLRGLDERKSYTVNELNNSSPKFWAEGETISGEFLVKAGLNPNLQNVYQSMVLYLESVD